jgi:uroporphyrinogen decarboxylase
LLAGRPAIRTAVAAALAAYGKGPGHVFNLGHGVSQFTSPDSVAALVDVVHELSPAYH